VPDKTPKPRGDTEGLRPGLKNLCFYFCLVFSWIFLFPIYQASKMPAWIESLCTRTSFLAAVRPILISAVTEVAFDTLSAIFTCFLQNTERLFLLSGYLGTGSLLASPFLAYRFPRSVSCCSRTCLPRSPPASASPPDSQSLETPQTLARAERTPPDD